MHGFSRFKNGPETQLRLKQHVFPPLGLPKAQPIAYIENIIAILSQLQLRDNAANFVSTAANFA